MILEAVFVNDIEISPTFFITCGEIVLYNRIKMSWAPPDFFGEEKSPAENVKSWCFAHIEKRNQRQRLFGICRVNSFKGREETDPTDGRPLI